MNLLKLMKKSKSRRLNFLIKKLETLNFLIDHASEFFIEDTSEIVLAYREYLKCVSEQYTRADYISLIKLRRRLGLMRFALPHQLDRTKPEQFGKGEEYETEHDLSFSGNLKSQIIGERVLYARDFPWGIIPEVSLSGKRRCIVLDHLGRRCKRYTEDGVICYAHRKHSKEFERFLKIMDVHSSMFKSSSLRGMYEDYMQSDARDMRSEIATMRTMLGALMNRIPEEVEADKLPFEYIEAVVKISKDVGNAIEKFDRIQHRMATVITAEQLNVLMFRFMEIVQRVCKLDSNKFLELAEALQSLSIDRKTSGTGFLTNGMDAYGEKAVEGHVVTHTTAKTRYGENEVVDVTPEIEEQHVQEQHSYLRSRYSDHEHIPEAIRNDEKALQFRTQINGVEVSIIDDMDPFHFKEEFLKL